MDKNGSHPPFVRTFRTTAKAPDNISRYILDTNPLDDKQPHYYEELLKIRFNSDIIDREAFLHRLDLIDEQTQRAQQRQRNVLLFMVFQTILILALLLIVWLRAPSKNSSDGPNVVTVPPVVQPTPQETKIKIFKPEEPRRSTKKNRRRRK